jgi:hypothetical protein
MTLELVKPALPYLAEYRAALETGWSADNVRGADAAREELAKIVADPTAFVARLDDPQAKSLNRGGRYRQQYREQCRQPLTAARNRTRIKFKNYEKGIKSVNLPVIFATVNWIVYLTR